MLTRVLRLLGLSTAEQVIGFLICGMAVLPTMLFVAGERNAAAVIMLAMINGLLVFAIRNRERENLREAEETAQREAARRRPAEDPPEPR